MTSEQPAAAYPLNEPVYVLIVRTDDGIETEPVVYGSLRLAQRQIRISAGDLHWEPMDDGDRYEARTADAVFRIYVCPVRYTA